MKQNTNFLLTPLYFFRKYFMPIWLILFLYHTGNAQDVGISTSDTSKWLNTPINLDEIAIFGKAELNTENKNQLADISKYLENSNQINMVKRGAYAWEPLINGMGSERGNITIDGMQIFSACTDKMDPITSYVEITNLSEVSVSSGQDGNEHGMGIAGSINLIRKRSDFSMQGSSGHVFAGYETANKHKTTGFSLENSQEKYYTDLNFTFRDASNYKAGGDLEIPFSQFTKYNASANVGYKVNANHTVESSFIYDHATDIGYPALPMDVSTAKAGIFSLQHSFTPEKGSFFHEWTTKAYYNSITHIMDDSYRPEVAIRMDMPGWSKTGGLYTQTHFLWKKHHIKTKLSAFRNTAFAEMTMYPNAADEKAMYMLTWPDVASTEGQWYIHDNIQLSNSLGLTISGSLAYHHAKIRDKAGFESLKIFHPDINQDKSRWLKNFSTSLQKQISDFSVSGGLAYGERAPDVSEGYGFYLFNSFDKYDYVGSPSLPNEKSIEGNLGAEYKKSGHSFKLTSHYFHIRDYIIGKPVENMSSMTIGAKGVKMYVPLDFAHIFNIAAEGKVQIREDLQANTQLSYRIGKDNNGYNLPMIQPFTHNTELQYKKNSYSLRVAAEGAAKHKAISSYYGELPVDAYTLLHLSFRKTFHLQGFSKQLYINLGVDNLLDKKYTTFSDWNRIPQMGRNFYTNLMLKF